MPKPVDLDHTADIARITINRPDSLNALTKETIEALSDALDRTQDARAVTITGAGDEAFIAGADIGYMQDLSTTEAYEFAKIGHDKVMRKIAGHPAPVIAAINGYAFGGGCEVALACDLRVASENATIGQPELDVGIIPSWGGIQRLARLVGDERARRMVFFSQRLSAKEALEVGLVGEVVAQEELDERVRTLAEDLADRPKIALQAAKEAFTRVHEAPLSAGLAYEQRLWSGLFGTHDQREGMAAFVEKRDPIFE
ncbi:enoyl-CoA hydratase/isomerase family protein [Haladaptatus halobius]|uniref:enoyl-CoA hydratase/isomerase family protein n=1 Tax=Haladaptatus halobius TaxID=2884875 RepID=UPI001D09BECF|nr:enoyl-CoA hydratase-related protein [Haladaptatus halobius]